MKFARVFKEAKKVSNELGNFIKKVQDEAREEVKGFYDNPYCDDAETWFGQMCDEQISQDTTSEYIGALYYVRMGQKVLNNLLMA